MLERVLLYPIKGCFLYEFAKRVPLKGMKQTAAAAIGPSH